MGFIDDKKEVVNSAALFEILGNLPKTKSTSSLASVNSKDKNLLPYLVDLLSVTCKKNRKGSTKNDCESKKILLEILTDAYPKLINKTKEIIPVAIKAGLACGADFKLPTHNVKIKTKLKNIDHNGLMKVNPTSSVGSTFYGKNANTDFNYFLNDSVRSGNQSTWKGIMDVKYDKPTEEIEFGLNNSYTNNGKSFDNFILDFTNSFEFMSKEQFVAKMSNKLTGSLNSSLGTSLDQLISMEKVDKLQDKIHNTDPCIIEYKIDDSYFKFSNEEISEIEGAALEKSKGVVNLDLGCGIVESSINSNTIKEVFDDIRNTEPSKATLVMENSINTLNNNLTTNVNEKDKKNAVNNLNTTFIKQIPKTLTGIVLEPNMVMLYEMCNKLVNGPLNPNTPSVGQPTPSNINVDSNLKKSNSFDYAKVTSVFFEKISRATLAILLEIIFNKIKEKIIKIVQDIVIKEAKRRVKLKIKLLTFLTGSAIDGLTAKATESLSNITFN
jgi:hypothetical protein